MKISTILFDFDGVVADTEPQYDSYLEKLGMKYLGISDLAEQVKGATNETVLKHFSHLSLQERDNIEKGIEDFEKQMDFPPVKGVIEFIHYLKEKRYKVGLVTSSPLFKMDIALKKMNLVGIFDVEITADDITKGKPDPMCYLLGAEKLNVSPSECFVLEDSMFGVQAGRSAGMRVIGLSTSVSAEKLKEKGAEIVIPDFTDISFFEKVMK